MHARHLLFAPALVAALVPFVALGGDEQGKGAALLADATKRLEAGREARKLDADQVRALLGGEATGTAKEPAIEAKDDVETTQKALELFARPAATFPYRMVEKDRRKSFVKHEVRWLSGAHTTDESDVVTGVYYEPVRATGGSTAVPDPKGKLPACVVVHHLGGSFEAEEILAQYLTQHGVVGMTLALPGYGARRAPNQPRAGFLGHKDPVEDLAGMRQAVLDVRRAADFLRTRPEVDADRVGVTGISLGAIVASVSAGVDARFARAVFVIGGGDFTKVLAGDSKEARDAMKGVRELGLSPADLKKAFDLVDPNTFAHRLRSDDVLMLNAEKDEIFPRESTEGLWRRAGYPRIKWYDTTHKGVVTHLGDVMNETLDHLRSKADPREAD